MTENGNTAGKRDRVLVLSIRPEHAERIFQGTKLFELRKRLPTEPFDRVYLYASGGGGIVGCFDAAEVIVQPVEHLWEAVGERATSHERFSRYFADRLYGFAIRIANPIKFKVPIFPQALRKQLPNFTAPMSFLIIRHGDPLYAILERKRCQQTNARAISLRPIEKRRYKQFERLVTKHISSRYDEITPNFAKAILKSHRLGHDPNGIFTTGKTVLQIEAPKSVLVGFTTLTWKIGGSVKTGPTILLPRYRGSGYGQATRLAVENFVLAKGARKLYCTCPDNDQAVSSYLLRAGYRIEAHLRSQYRAQNGEFVFGKMLREHSVPRKAPIRSRSSECQVVDVDTLVDPQLIKCIVRLFGFAGVLVDETRASSIVESAKSHTTTSYEEKPHGLLCLQAEKGCRGILMSIPKRGGSVKLLCGCDTTHTPSIRNLIVTAERHAKDAARRKLYFLLPHDDLFLNQLLRQMDYVAEGILREPYQAGVDCIVLSKLI